LQLDDDADNIICYKKDSTQDNWKIALPESMIADTVKWFHEVMKHPGDKDYENHEDNDTTTCHCIGTLSS
jgi:hypothetical protein